MNTSFMVLMTIIDFTAAIIIFSGALSERMRLFPTWHKVGMIVAVMGLVAQGLRNIHFLFTGISPSDLDMPFWALKDLGIALVAYYYLAKAIKGHTA